MAKQWKSMHHLLKPAKIEDRDVMIVHSKINFDVKFSIRPVYLMQQL